MGEEQDVPVHVAHRDEGRCPVQSGRKVEEGGEKGGKGRRGRREESAWRCVDATSRSCSDRGKLRPAVAGPSLRRKVRRLPRESAPAMCGRCFDRGWDRGSSIDRSDCDCNCGRIVKLDSRKPRLLTIARRCRNSLDGRLICPIHQKSGVIRVKSPLAPRDRHVRQAFRYCPSDASPLSAVPPAYVAPAKRRGMAPTARIP